MIKHQLNIHLDYGPGVFQHGGLSIKYGYPRSGRHTLREQDLRISAAELDAELKEDLDFIYGALERRIPEPARVRLPHAEIRPTIQPAILTFVVLDQNRAEFLPIARLYFYEVVEPLNSRIEGKVYLEKPDWMGQEVLVCERVKQAARKLAWGDYERLIGHHLLNATDD